MEIIVEKLTDEVLMRRACEMTIDKKSKIPLGKMYKLRHSPMRTQMFWVEMLGIYSYVSVHFVRHKIGVEHFVKSLRDDRGGDGTENRYTPVNHGMLINAESLITMSHKRLCAHAAKDTIEVMEKIALAVKEVDPDLYLHMVPNCLYIKKCHERDAKCAPVLARQAKLFDWKNRRV